VAAAFLALHLVALPSSLGDLDSINFALGVRDFDVSQHQPHPPGYPLYILAAKMVYGAGHTAGGIVHADFTEAHALSLVGIVAGSLAVFAILGLFTEWNRDVLSGGPPWAATLVVMTCPLFWLTAARPLSDTTGLAAALGVQLLIVRSKTAGQLAVAAASAGLAAGVRSQVVALTAPLLLLAVVRLPGGSRISGTWRAAAAYAAGCLVWLIPLIWISGGASAYWHALSNQGSEDLSGVAMLATMPSVTLFVRALASAFVAPWGYWQLAAAVLGLAAAGTAQMLWRARPALLSLLVAFAPYALFDMLFQESVTIRYALPLVVPVAYLAVRGASWLPRTPAMAVALALIVSSVAIDDRTLFAYARSEAPVFRMLGDMAARREAAGASFVSPVLAMHRREALDSRRPIQWVGDGFPPVAARLASPPKHEWLELVRYWNGGGRQPVWFIADPLRSDLALIRYHGRPVLYRWSFEPSILVGGSRPGEMDWHAIERPDWYLGEGWALTPETAGVAAEDHKGPGYGPISGWIGRWSSATLMVGGRNLASDGSAAHVSVAIDGREVDAVDVAPGFFLRMLSVSPAAGAGSGDYAEVRIVADRHDLAIEQIDAQPAGQVVFGFGDGWHEGEYNPATGQSWRWTSDQALLRVRAEGHAVALTLRGEIEAASSSHVTIRAGGRVVGEFEAPRQFSRTVLIPADAVAGSEATIAIQSSAWYIPAESRWRSADHRRLGLKIYECAVSPVS
jgi:hypothetical protein